MSQSQGHGRYATRLAPPVAGPSVSLDRAATCALMLGALLTLTTCATGKEPPALTKMANLAVAGTFVFGVGEQGCRIPRTKADCDKNVQFDPGQPTATVEIKPFAIDVHEVTNEQYRFCVEMEKCSLPPGDNGPSGIGDYFTNARYNTYPVVAVRLKQAEEYCNFAGKRLPTEFEWEMAAGGAVKTVAEKRIYPWAKPGFQGPLSQCDKDVNIAKCNGGTQLTRPVQVSTADVVLIGGTSVYDLFGNVAEFTISDAKQQLTCDWENPVNPYGCQDCGPCLLTTRSKGECEKVCLQCVCGANSQPSAKPNCYQPCDNPICPRRLGNATPLVGYHTGKNFEQLRVVRGGSFYNHSNKDDKMSCDGRADNRAQTVGPTGDPQYHYGFRCVKAL
ncbi:MAG: formylglycine-generating enzyme family protein [Myxococcales bacterium]|nr:formylglycine-generating enzyme family protein [Myxococcales bacterium]